MSVTISEIESVYQNATCLYRMEIVEKALDEMAFNITNTLKTLNPIVMCVMSGGVVPTAGLLKRLDFPLELDYLHVTRYRGKTHGGELHWRAEPRLSLQNRVILVVDDILDGGVTLAEIIAYCEKHSAQKIYTAVLVVKERIREARGLSTADFVGLKTENKYLFGYGLDYKEYLRNAPGIFAVQEK